MKKVSMEDGKRMDDIGYIQSYAESDGEDDGKVNDDSSFELDDDDSVMICFPPLAPSITPPWLTHLSLILPPLLHRKTNRMPEHTRKKVSALSKALAPNYLL